MFESILLCSQSLGLFVGLLFTPKFITSLNPNGKGMNNLEVIYWTCGWTLFIANFLF